MPRAFARKRKVTAGARAIDETKHRLMANDGQASAKTTAVEKKNRYDGAREKRAEETVKGVTRTRSCLR